MSETDLARSWGVLTGRLARGGEEDMLLAGPKEKEGRCPWTELSARDLSCSDQLNPWSFDPGLPLPVRLRMAGAPKLMRRVKGVTGAVRLLSSSSMAFSSIESEFVEMLPRRKPLKAPLLVVGEVPARPMPVVAMESRLRLGSEGGKLTPMEVELLRNRPARACCVTEPRRLGFMSVGLFWLSVDIVAG